MPYNAVTLMKNVAYQKFKGRKLVHITTVESRNDSTVVPDALKVFENDSLTLPLYPEIKGVTEPYIRIDKHNIVKKEIGF